MTDLHIFGLPRSGTSFSFYYLTELLRHAGVDVVDLFEPSNPWLKLVPKKVGYKVAGFERPDDGMLENRMRMYQSHAHENRLVKHCFTPPCIPYMDLMLRGDDLKWIELKRDRFERYLSWVIANRSGVWVTTSQDRMDRFRQELTPFESPIDDLHRELESNKLYDDYLTSLRDRGERIGVIDYDTMFDDCDRLRPAVLHHYGVADPDANRMSIADLEKIEGTLPKKSLTLDEKKKIVLNWRELKGLMDAASD